MLFSFFAFLLGVFALYVGNWVAVIICFPLSYMIFLPVSYIRIRKLLGLWD